MFGVGLGMAKLSKVFSKKLKQVRKAKGLTQESFAELLNKSVRHIQDLEGGQKCNVSLDKLQKLAKALKVKPQDLI